MVHDIVIFTLIGPRYCNLYTDWSTILESAAYTLQLINDTGQILPCQALIPLNYESDPWKRYEPFHTIISPLEHTHCLVRTSKFKSRQLSWSYIIFKAQTLWNIPQCDKMYTRVSKLSDINMFWASTFDICIHRYKNIKKTELLVVLNNGKLDTF